MSKSSPLHDDFDESEGILHDLNVLLNETSDEISPRIIKCISKAFTCYSAHVRGKALDLLAKRAGPKLWLPNASQAGDLVLWHADDPDARVRDRALHCILTWMRLTQGGGVGRRRRAIHPAVTSAGSHPGTGGASGRTAQLESERKDWLTTNVEAVYTAGCSGLLDVDHVVRRTSLRVLCQLSLAYPRYQLSTAAPGPHRFCPGKTSEKEVDSDQHLPQPLVDDAFVRICLRLQDSNRQVRQLAAQLLSSLAKSVGSDRLLQTLEKTVMSDRQVRCSLLSSTSSSTATTTTTTTGGTFAGNGSSSGSSLQHRQHHHQQNQGRVVDAGERQAGRKPLREFNITATGSSGAIITGLEDDFSEVRCATLATVTHVASLDAKFAQKCQDLLVDMLTDDIQDVRLAAVCAMGAVGDKVSLQAEQVTIITSALAEGSGQIRRRLHRLLSTCRLASAPCLISLLDGLLHNLRRYPRDRDSLWRCAASVGRRHPTFVETCLSSLLHTHSWLSGPEPNREDPAYLTVLLVVLNAEPGAPGMSAKFPRHLAATKVYLHELVPALLPEPLSTDLYLSPDACGEDLGYKPAAKKHKLMTTTTAVQQVRSVLRPPFTVHTESLTKFLTSFVQRTIDVLTEAREQLLSCKFDPRKRATGFSEDTNNKSRL